MSLHSADTFSSYCFCTLRRQVRWNRSEEIWETYLDFSRSDTGNKGPSTTISCRDLCRRVKRIPLKCLSWCYEARWNLQYGNVRRVAFSRQIKQAKRCRLTWCNRCETGEYSRLVQAIANIDPSRRLISKFRRLDYYIIIFCNECTIQFGNKFVHRVLSIVDFSYQMNGRRLQFTVERQNSWHERSALIILTKNEMLSTHDIVVASANLFSCIIF